MCGQRACPSRTLYRLIMRFILYQLDDCFLNSLAFLFIIRIAPSSTIQPVFKSISKVFFSCSVAIPYDWRNPIRSMTIQAINLFPQDMPEQIDLFCDYEKVEKQEKLDCCIEKLRERFGKRCIRNAVLLQELGIPMGNVEITMPTGLVK